MARLLVKNADYIVTMNKSREVVRSGDIIVEGERIAQVGRGLSQEGPFDKIIDASGKIILPGLINTHHHLYQNLTRNLPSVQSSGLFHWLTTLYDIWENLEPEDVYVSALIGLAELVLSGCTTVSDHYYIFPRGKKGLLEAEIRAAQEIGVRFHPARGSMSLGRDEGGLPPQSLIEREEEVVEDYLRLIQEFHDGDKYSMIRLILAPTSPFSTTVKMMRETMAIAEKYGLACHTHLAETLDEEKFCLEKFGRRPYEYLEEVGWNRPNVWLAHAIHLNQDEIKRMAKDGVGMTYCPSSNMRLGSGIAPVVEMLEAGVKVSLGVDGSSSNDSSHLLAEARMALLSQRVRYGAEALAPTQVLEIGTLGGAKVLGRDDIGSLEADKAADMIFLNTNRLEYAGAHLDPVSMLVLCHPANADMSMINGEVVVEDGVLKNIDLESVLEKHRCCSTNLIQKAEKKAGKIYANSSWIRAFD